MVPAQAVRIRFGLESVQRPISKTEVSAIFAGSARDATASMTETSPAMTR